MGTMSIAGMLSGTPQVMVKQNVDDAKATVVWADSSVFGKVVPPFFNHALPSKEPLWL